MKKPQWTDGIKKCSDAFPKKIFDDTAETVAEMAAATGQSESNVRRAIRKNLVDKKQWEQVWKRVGSRPFPAYRLKK
jgi:hypothetical protein